MIVFADTSALIKLYVEEAGSSRMRELVQDSTVAVSMLAFAEAHATFARRLREGWFDSEEYAQIQAQFARGWRSYIHILLDVRTQLEIPRLCSLYPLRGGDAVQLASALVLHREGLDVRFACCDQRLLSSAEAEGLKKVDPAVG